MVAISAIAGSGRKSGPIKRLLIVPFYPLIAIWRWLFRRKNKVDRPTPIGSTSNRERSATVENAVSEEIWSELRLETCERLWGEGCLNPFNAAYLVNAMRLLDMDESKSLLQIGAGLGGTSRAMADQNGVWITGFEENEDLLEISKMRNQMAGLSKKAAISRFRPDAPNFKENGFNVAVSFEALTSIEDKQIIIQNAAKSLRGNGHFIMADYVLPSGDPPNEIVMNWYNREKIRPKLWTARRTYDTIKETGLDVRIAEDFTAEYRSMVLTGWLRLLSGLTKKELTPDFAEVLIRECEFWIYRIAALDSGGLKVYRYHAIKEAS